MPRELKPSDLFKGIKKAPIPRVRRAAKAATPAEDRIISDARPDTVTFCLTIERALFEAYKNEGKGHFAAPMRRQLARRFRD